MNRFKRGIPSVLNPSKLSQIVDCDRDKLSDYCRYYGYDIDMCYNKTNSGCKVSSGNDNGSQSSNPQNSFNVHFFHEKTAVLLVGATIHAIITIVCFLSAAMFLMLLVFRSNQLQYPVYKLIMQLSICYLLLAIAQCFSSIPLYLFNFNSDQSITKIPLLLDQIGNFGGVIFYSLLTVNRLVIFVFTPLKPMFEGKALYVTLSIGWALSIGSAVLVSFFGCARVYDGEKGVYVDECTPGSPVFWMVYQVLFYSVIVLPFIDLIVYIVIGISIFIARKRAMMKINRTEIDLFMQSAFIVVFYTLTDVIFLIESTIRTTNHDVIILLNILNNLLNILLGLIFVVTFVISNKTVRSAARQLYIPSWTAKQSTSSDLMFHKRSSMTMTTTSGTT